MSGSTFIGKIDKIIIFNQVRVNGKINYMGVNPPPLKGKEIKDPIGGEGKEKGK